MKYLLDTHTFLWWMQDAPELPEGVRRILSSQTSDVAFSVLSAWEIIIKTGTGKLSGVPLEELEKSVAEQGFPVLPFDLGSVARVAQLPPLHQDPFDRGLIATALHHDLVVLTRDSKFGGYGVKVFWGGSIT